MKFTTLDLSNSIPHNKSPTIPSYEFYTWMVALSASAVMATVPPISYIWMVFAGVFILAFSSILGFFVSFWLGLLSWWLALGAVIRIGMWFVENRRPRTVR